MNRIEAIVGESEFVHEPHLRFMIDGHPLDEILSAAFPQKKLGGLVPTTLNWLETQAEQDEVWKRFTETSIDKIVVPLLCCPDDLDFSCSIVVADVMFTPESVTWVQFGLDATPPQRLPHGIGENVEWLPGLGPFEFTRASYDMMVKTFQKSTHTQTLKRG